MAAPDKKRQNLFIQKKFQLRSIIIVIGIIAASGLLSSLLLYVLLSSELSADLLVAHQQIQNTWDKLGPAIMFGNIITVLVTGFAAAVAVLYQSHKIAGPMYRLQEICKQVAQGDYNPVTSLRKADQLTALANSFEEMLVALRETRQQQNNTIEAAHATLDTILQEQDRDKQLQLLDELGQTLESARTPQSSSGNLETTAN